jgi:hypothetical protein
VKFSLFSLFPIKNVVIVIISGTVKMVQSVNQLLKIGISATRQYSEMLKQEVHLGCMPAKVEWKPP